MEKSTIRTLGITYKMLKGEGEAVETFLEVPISSKRYKELQSIVEGCQTYNDIREALVVLTRLQGYDELGAWSFDLEVETK